ncbi:helix-turn-helix transcriptional regulator [candidate division FCPU426 bacterium]|nr:helix-turn-helix transcriptional regulator [candidate division FCPU426 bacterium]
MLAVVKTPHIDLCIRGKVPHKLLACLRTEFGKDLHLEAEEEKVDFFKTTLYRKTKQSITPGAYVRIYRQNLGLTQSALGKKLKVSKAFICDLEHNRRGISKKLAQTMSWLFQVDVARFIGV